MHVLFFLTCAARIYNTSASQLSDLQALRAGLFVGLVEYALALSHDVSGGLESDAVAQEAELMRTRHGHLICTRESHEALTVFEGQLVPLAICHRYHVPCVSVLAATVSAANGIYIVLRQALLEKLGSRRGA